MRARHVLTILALLASSLTAALLLGAPARAAGGCTAPVALGADTDPYAVRACFDEPAGGADTTVLRLYIDTVDSAQDGDQVRVALYRIQAVSCSHVADGKTQKPLVTALLAAQRRGADVRVILDRDRHLQVNDHVIKVLRGCDGQGDKVAEVKVCDVGNDCLLGKDSAIMHSKFIVVRPPAGSGRDPVVVQASYNALHRQDEVSQNALEVTGRSDLTGRYLAFWRSLESDHWVGPWKDGRDFWTDDSTLGLHVSPSDNDYLAKLLSHVSCPKSTTDPGQVFMAQSDVDGRTAVRKQLARLSEAGCQVHVVVRSTDARSQILQHFKGIGDVNKGQVRVVPLMHDKLTVIQAPVSGTARTMVVTGSQNLTDGSIDNCGESVLQLRDTTLTDRFAEHFDRMWTSAG